MPKKKNTLEDLFKNYENKKNGSGTKTDPKKTTTKTTTPKTLENRFTDYEKKNGKPKTTTTQKTETKTTAPSTKKTETKTPKTTVSAPEAKRDTTPSFGQYRAQIQGLIGGMKSGANLQGLKLPERTVSAPEWKPDAGSTKPVTGAIKPETKTETAAGKAEKKEPEKKTTTVTPGIGIPEAGSTKPVTGAIRPEAKTEAATVKTEKKEPEKKTTTVTGIGTAEPRRTETGAARPGTATGTTTDFAKGIAGRTAGTAQPGKVGAVPTWDKFVGTEAKEVKPSGRNDIEAARQMMVDKRNSIADQLLGLKGVDTSPRGTYSARMGSGQKVTDARGLMQKTAQSAEEINPRDLVERMPERERQETQSQAKPMYYPAVQTPEVTPEAAQSTAQKYAELYNQKYGASNALKNIRVNAQDELRRKEAEKLGVPVKYLGEARKLAADQVKKQVDYNKWVESKPDTKSYDYGEWYVKGVKEGYIKSQEDNIIAQTDDELINGIEKLQADIANYKAGMKNAPEKPVGTSDLYRTLWDMGMTDEPSSTFEQDKAKFDALPDGHILKEQMRPYIEQQQFYKEMSDWENTYGETGLKKLTDELERYETELEYRQHIIDLKNEGVSDKFSYRYLPEHLRDIYDTMDPRKFADAEKTDADIVYMEANNGISQGFIRDDYSRLGLTSYMPEEAKKQFNVLYNNKEYDAAMEVYYHWEDLLTEARTAVTQEEAADVVNGKYGHAMSYLAGILTIPESAGLGIIGLGASLFGIAGLKPSKSSEYYRRMTWNQAVRNEFANNAAEEFGDAGRFFVNVGFSILDNMYALGMAKLGTMGKAWAMVPEDVKAAEATRMVQLIMSGEATSYTLIEQINKGRSAEEAAVMALGAGAIEWITEKFSAERYLNPGKALAAGTKHGFIQYMVKSMLAEGSEEIAADLLNTQLDYICSIIWDNETEIEALYKEKYNQYRDAGMNDAEAQKMACNAVTEAYASQLLQSGLAGAVSAVPLSGVSYVTNNMSIRSTGKAILNNDNYEANVRQMVKTIKNADMGETATRLAAQVEDKLNNKTKLKRGEVGALAQAVMQNGSAQVREFYKDTYAETIAEELERKGLGQADARKQGEIIAKSVLQGTQALTRTERNTLLDNGEASELMLDLTQEIASENRKLQIEMQEKAAARSENTQAAMNMTEYAMSGRNITRDVSDYETAEGKRKTKALQDKHTAIDADIINAELKSRETGNVQTGHANEVVTPEGFGDIRRFVTEMEETENEDGEKVKKPVFRAEVATADGKTELVDLAAIKATNGEVAKLIAKQRLRPGLLGDAYMSDALGYAAQLGDNMNELFADEVEDIKIAAALGMKMPSVTMDTETAEKLYNTAQLEREQINRKLENTARKVVQNIRQGEGKLKFDGAEQGTDEYNEKVKDLGYTAGLEIKLLEEFAKQSGISTVNLITDEAHSEQHGTTESTGQVNINVKALMEEGGATRSILSIAGHEICGHLLRSVSTEAYDELVRFVAQHQEDAGQSFKNLILKQYDNYAEYGKTQSLDEAIEDVVAKSMETVLTSEKMYQQLRDSVSPTVFGKIKTYVKDLITRIKNVLSNVFQTSSSEGQRMLKLRDQLADIWLTGMEKAQMGLDSQQGQEGQQKGIPHVTEGIEFGGKSYSTAQVNETIDAINEAEANPVEHFSIRFKNPIQVSKKNGLIAVHNLTIDNIMENIRLGGIAMPSIAVKREGTAWTKFADCSVFFKRNALNFDDNTVYQGDAYTPSMGGQHVDTAQEALDYLNSQKKRLPKVARSLSELFRNFKSVVSIDQARRIAQQNEERDPGQYSRDRKAQTDLEKQIIEEARQAIDDVAMSHMFYYTDGTITQAVGIGMMLAQEDIERAGDISTEEKYDILEERIQESMDTFGLSKDMIVNPDFSPIYDKMLQYGEMMTLEPSESGMMESKPNMIMDFAKDIAVMSLPDTTTAEQLKTIMDAGVARENIFLYPANDQKAREDSLKLISDIRPDVKFSLATNQKQNSVQDANTIANAAKEVGLMDIGDGVIEDSKGEKVLKVLPGDTATKYSLRSWDEDNQDKIRNMLLKAGHEANDVDRWIGDVNSIAAIIAEDRGRLDYTPDRRQRYRKPNSDVYKYTLDASTLCKKRLVYQGTMNEIMKRMPNTALKPGDLIELANMMKDMGYTTPCGICYVESNRRHAGNFSEEFIRSYERNHPDGYIPQIKDLVSTEGLYQLREEHPEVYKAYIAANNRRGSGSVKPVQLRTDYRKDVRRITKATVEYLNSVGGLRIQSFSDFETPHLIDMAQALLDMSAKGLKAQAYTKVTDFAEIFGPSGIKINLSLMGEGNGVDANGNLIFSSTEGMDFDKAMELRDMYSDNVGTILVGMNDEHIIAAMGDDRIDYIIPFHKSGWSQNELDKMKSLKGYQDYQATQNERNISDGKKAEHGISINDYWDYTATGTENAQRYLDKCWELKLIPKFDQFLKKDKNGKYILPKDGSKRSENIRKGYWKLLIDYKMYNNDGDGVKAKQKAVTPDINMKAAKRVLGEYEGGADTLPVAMDVVDRFVGEYNANRIKGTAASAYGNMTMGNEATEEETEETDDSVFATKPKARYADEENVRRSMRTPDMDVNQFMENLKPSELRTEAERKLLADYRSLRTKIGLQNIKIDETKNKIRELEAKGQLDAGEKKLLERLKIRLENAKTVRDEYEQKLVDVTSDEGYAKIMMQHSRLISDYMEGRTQDQVMESVTRLKEAADSMMKRIDKTAEELKNVAQDAGIKRIRAMMNKNNLDKTATDIRKTWKSDINKQELMDEIARIRLEVEQGEDDRVMEDVEALAGKVLESAKGEKSEALKLLRGTTITLGPSQVREVLGTNRSISDLRKELAGTGIKIRTATDAEIRSGAKTSLDNSWSEICQMLDNRLDPNTAAEDQVFKLIDFIRGEIRNENTSQYSGELAEVMSDLLGKVVNVNMNQAADPAVQNELKQIQDYVQGLAKKAEISADAVDQLRGMMTEVIRSGKQAATWTDAMKRDVANTIEYLDRTARLAEDTARSEKLRETVAKLRSEAAEKLMKANQEWRDLIERDRQTRLQQEANDATRRQIDTVAKRITTRLSAPKLERNVSEHMNGLAREVLETIVDNDLAGRRLTNIPKSQLIDTKRRLNAWKMRDGEFNLADLQDASDDTLMSIINNDLETIYDGIHEWNGRYNGKNRLETTQMRGETLKRIQEAVSEIYSAIKSEGEVFINKRKVSVADAAEAVKEGLQGRTKQVLQGKGARALNTLHKFIVTDNMTPEYFIRYLDNPGLSEAWENHHEAENRNGLEQAKAQKALQEIADRHGYDQWDMKEKHQLQMDNGRTVEMTTGQLMSLYATWNREQQLGPEMSEHLRKGGFYSEIDLNSGRLHKGGIVKRANRVTENDMAKVGSMLTDEQKDFVDDVVRYMSEDMSQLGNEASMKTWGIKLYKEKYYFPFKMWDGIKNRKATESGQAANADNVFHPSFSKTRLHGARNALIIGDFMETAADHIVGMINYATFGPANEALNKMLNYQFEEGSDPDNITKRNLNTMMEQAYGKEAMDYLQELKTQLNGGAVKITKSAYDKAISLFRKNAVAGSLSVAMQQPLSYLRAATVIDAKYLAKALTQEYWKDSYKERMEHSGLSVIKDMGKFDMNAGQSARQYITPEGKKSKGRKAWDAVTDAMTILPEKMDELTWNRIWVAAKLEQHDLHPEMDMKSDEFLDMTAERFNQIMRLTQVYDSVLVRSANMRSQNPITKNVTSFMAEPTLTINVLADAVRQAKAGKPGGMKAVAKAGTTYIMSAILQAVVKGFAGAGRNPDEDKTALENFMYRFGNNMISEIDPITQIPAYSDLITILKKGELTDDAMGAVGKLVTAGKTGIDLLLGKDTKGTYRGIEDSVGQIAQLFTNLPAKNLMRDARMLYNWIIEKPFAERDTSAAVLKYQFKDQLATGDNIAGTVNKWLTDAGYGYDTKNQAYKERYAQALMDGDERKAEEIKEYLTLGKGVSEKSIDDAAKRSIKNDANLSGEEKIEIAQSEGWAAEDLIRQQLKEGEITPEHARKVLAREMPDKSENDIWWTVDRIEYQNETGNDPKGSKYYRLYDAMDNNSADEIGDAVQLMKDHGMEAKNIRTQITKKYKDEYIAADNDGKRRIRDAVQKAYKKLGYTAEDADKVINKWK